MSSAKPPGILTRARGRSPRLAVAVLLAALTGGCFQPMYGEHNALGGTGLGDKLRHVEVTPINAPNGSRESRLGVEVRNALLFGLNGSGATYSPTHRLAVRLITNRSSVIVDVTTSRAESENYGIDAAYELREIATDKIVMTGSTFARVSYNIPGQEQRFARIRGMRDAEDRAAKVIADNISQRLASYFVSGG
jgi:LPS-assembly lipoprotein